MTEKPELDSNKSAAPHQHMAASKVNGLVFNSLPKHNQNNKIGKSPLSLDHKLT